MSIFEVAIPDSNPDVSQAEGPGLVASRKYLIGVGDLRRL